MTSKQEFQVVASDLELNTADAPDRKIKWAVATSLLACAMLGVVVFMSSATTTRQPNVNVYGKMLPNNGILRADIYYDCDTTSYCSTAGAQCETTTTGLAVMRTLDAQVLSKCEFTKIAEDLSTPSTFLALAPKLEGYSWACKDLILQSCYDGMPGGCPYLELCGEAEENNILDVLTAASEFKPSDLNALEDYKQVWTALAEPQCSIALNCAGVVYDSSTCSKKTKSKFARRLIGKAMAKVNMDASTASKMADLISCMSCDINVGGQDYVRLDKEFQSDLGMMFGLEFDRKLPLAKTRSFKGVEDLKATIDPAWAEPAVCHPLCTTFLKGQLGIFTHVYQSCCAVAPYD
ncbi:hypothetical protein FVE85_2919 [Porphyridium purpureum]|uniref:Uncharacterized protein n=1 Tax=Porphyridium purpureum TaxID=35688 RepID=A0A5J4YU16_PORPP|nr:hypothetical protein FVE85_2919 [Porphyridium purpureum]|eukprot:POR3494..scf227_4